MTVVKVKWSVGSSNRGGGDGAVDHGDQDCPGSWNTLALRQLLCCSMMSRRSQDGQFEALAASQIHVDALCSRLWTMINVLIFASKPSLRCGKNLPKLPHAMWSISSETQLWADFPSGTFRRWLSRSLPVRAKSALLHVCQKLTGQQENQLDNHWSQLCEYGVEEALQSKRSVSRFRFPRSAYQVWTCGDSESPGFTG